MNRTRILIGFAVIGLLVVIIFKVIGLQLAVFIGFSLAGWFVYKYNRLQSLSQEILESHSNIMIAMKKRMDLANKLIEIASSYGSHEQMTQLGVAKLESLPTSIESSGRSIDGLLGSFMSMSRAYPDLQANQTYQMLMKQLEDLETDLQSKREQYNIKVRSYNTQRTTIPMVFISEQLGFKPASYFDAGEADSMENLKEFRSADGTQLKTFLQGLGTQVTETSSSLTNDLGNVTRNLIENSKNGSGKDAFSHQDTSQTLDDKNP
jgi:LemA protein